MARYALTLSGYENASIWGYDSQEMTYFAQMWRNESDSWNDPEIWLNWFTRQRQIASPLELAELISARTGATTPEVLRAMAATSAPESPGLVELADRLTASAT